MRKLEEKRARINAEIQRVKARERQAVQKRDTRRKILAGAMVLDRVARGELAEKLFKDDMESLPGAGPGSGGVWAAAPARQTGSRYNKAG